LILIVSLLLLARRQGKTLSQLVATLPPRFTASGLLKNCPVEKSRAILARFATGNETKDQAVLERDFGPGLGNVTKVDRTDGIRVTFANNEIIHLRPSGNAPEFRGYTEAASEARALELNQQVMSVLSRLTA
jgi:phosphomannomutase